MAERRVPEQPEVWALHPQSPLLHLPGAQSARWSNTDPVDNIITGVRYAATRYAPPWRTILGWFTSGGTPIYDALVAERGDPFRST